MSAKAIIYTRFSPRRKADQCESCEVQEAACRQHCEAHGREVVAVFRDKALSGRSADRPGLAAAMEAVCRHRAVLVCYSLSRFARSTKDTLTLVERLGRAGANLVCLRETIDTTSPVGRFVFTLLAALQQLEREQTAERTSEAMRHYQSQGRRMSARPPLGWRVSNHVDPETGKHSWLEPEPAEEAMIERIIELRRAGLGARKIARFLDEEGFTCRGKPPYISMVQRVLKGRQQQAGP